MKKKVYGILIAVFAVAFLASAIYLGMYFVRSKREADQYNALAQMVDNVKNPSAPTAPAETQPGAPTEATQPTQNPNTPDPEVLAPYQEVYTMNRDTVGWIKIDGTVINYPVMQTSVENRDYYLRRNYYQEYEENGAGSIYAREECDVFKPSDNVTLYGHNMRNGSMFHCLLDYENKKTWEDNSLIFFDTLYEYHTYQIFAVFKTTATLDEGFAYHRMEDASNKEEFDAFVAKCKDLAFYDTGITPVYGDKLLCLSTCEYTQENGRFVVAAVRLD